MSDNSDEIIVNYFKPHFDSITFYSWLREPDFCNNYEQRWNKDNQISDLKAQIKEKDSIINAVETPENETNTNDETTETTPDTVEVSGGPYIENGYLYLLGRKKYSSLEDKLYNYKVDQKVREEYNVDKAFTFWYNNQYYVLYRFFRF